MSIRTNYEEDIKLEEIEKILRRKDPNNEAPPQLQPQEIHKLYKDIELQYYNDPYKLKRFEQWEQKTSKRIIDHFKLKQKPNFIRKYSHSWLNDAASFRKKDYDSFRKILYSYKLNSQYLKRTYEEDCKRDRIGFCKKFEVDYWEVTEEDFVDAFREELVEFFPKLYLTHPKSDKYISNNEFVNREYNSRSKSGIKQLVRMLYHETDISKNRYNSVYPFLNINRLVLFFWLEQTKPLLSPNMILAEIRKAKNIGKHELDVFLLWLFEVVENLDEYNKSVSREEVKKQIIKPLSDLYVTLIDKNPFENTVSANWDKFREIKNNGKNKRIKPLLNDNNIEQFEKYRTKYNLPERKRLYDIVSKQSKS